MPLEHLVEIDEIQRRWGRPTSSSGGAMTRPSRRRCARFRAACRILLLLALPVEIARAEPEPGSVSSTPASRDLESGDLGSPVEASRWRPELGVAFQTGFPQDDFIADTGFGAAIFAGVGLPDLPVVLGAEFAFQVDENDRRTLAETAVSEVEARTDSDIAMLHFVARLQPVSGRFRPYFDAMIGFKEFETRTRIDENFDDFGDPDDCIFTDCTRPIDNDKNSSDIALSYGVGAGLDVRIYRVDAAVISLVAGVHYLFGEEAKYVDPSSVRIIDANTVQFVTVRSRTDLLTTQLGIDVQF